MMYGAIKKLERRIIGHKSEVYEVGSEIFRIKKAHKSEVMKITANDSSTNPILKFLLKNLL